MNAENKTKNKRVDDMIEPELCKTNHDEKKLKDDMKWSKKLDKLQEEKEQLERELKNLKTDYDALANGIYRKDGSDTHRLFRVELTFHESNCGHVLGHVVCEDLLLAKLVQASLQKMFADRVTVSTDTKKEICSDDSTWNYV